MLSFKKNRSLSRTSFLFLALLISIMSFVTGCNKENTAKTKPLIIGILPDIHSMPFVIAQEKGFFQDEGIDVRIEKFKSAMDRDAALQAGKLDGVISDLLAVAFFQDGGFPIKVTSRTEGDYSLVVSKASGIKDIMDLKDKEIAVSKNTIIEFVTDEILVKNGLPTSAIKKVVIPQIPTRLEMLQNGKLSAATLPEPMASIAVQNGAVLLSSADAFKIKPSVMAFSEKALKDKEMEIKKLYRVYNRAALYLNNTKREDYIDILVEKGSLPPKAKEAMILPKFTPATLPTREDVRAVIDWLNAKNLTNKSYTYEDIVVNILP